MRSEITFGIDLGGTNTKIGLFKNERKFIDQVILATRQQKTKEELIDKITDNIDALIKKHLKDKSQVKAIGIGVAGPVDFKKGFIHELVNVPGWKEVPLKKILTKKTGIETFLDNDVNLVTLGEQKYGAGKGAKNMICITLGTGVGGGLIIDGKLYRGSNYTAGEIGHIPINVEGPKCNCGGIACLERYVGNKYIVQQAKDLLEKKQDSKILELAEGDLSNITPKLLHQAASSGDKLAISIWTQTGVYIGVALAGLVNVLNPERIVIGGGVAKAGDILFNSIKETVNKRAMKTASESVKMLPAELGDQAGIIGASILANSY
jgi:glucokinase